MRLIHYLEIENFRRFPNIQRIELDHPSILIGPNNCGKTTAIETIGLWSQTAHILHESTETSSSKQSFVPSIPQSQFATKSFWHNAEMRRGNQDISMAITVGLQHDNKVVPVTMRFQSGGKDGVDISSDPTILDKPEVLAAAAKLNVSLLYPISRLETNEHVLELDHIRELTRKGQTAQALRNICLRVREQSPEVWEKIVDQMQRLFSIELHQPLKNSQGTIDLLYKQTGVADPLGISFAGQGLQQILMILACLYSHNQSVILIDEPDTHLEILRQKQIYILLRDIAKETESQVVLTTHSDVLIDEGLNDGNLTLLLKGRTKKLPRKQDILSALAYFGTQQYILAHQYGHVLYLEGDTDFDILNAFAKKLYHPTAQNWNKPINTYYVRDNYPNPDMDSELQRIEGGFGITSKKHFCALYKLVPELRGLAILDGDGKIRKSTKDHLPTVFWKRYEIENYFITRELLIKSIEHSYGKHPRLDDYKKLAHEILNSIIQKHVFGDSQQDFDVWNEAPPETQQLKWEEKTKTCKLSTLAEKFYRKFANEINNEIKHDMLYTKGTLYQLIDLVEPESIPKEITEKLDLIQDLLENSSPQE